MNRGRAGTLRKTCADGPGTPSSPPPLGFFGSGLAGRQVCFTTFFLLKAGTTAVDPAISADSAALISGFSSAPWSFFRVNTKSSQTSDSLPACRGPHPHLTPHPSEISPPCLLPDGVHGSSGWREGDAQGQGRPGVPAGLCCHLPGKLGLVALEVRALSHRHGFRSSLLLWPGCGTSGKVLPLSEPRFPRL